MPNTLPHRCRLLRRWRGEQTVCTTFLPPLSPPLSLSPTLHVCLMGNLNKVSRQFICINMLSLCVSLSFSLTLFVCAVTVCVCVRRMFLYANLRAFCCRFVILSVCPFVALSLCRFARFIEFCHAIKSNCSKAARPSHWQQRRHQCSSRAPIPIATPTFGHFLIYCSAAAFYFAARPKVCFAFYSHFPL